MYLPQTEHWSDNRQAPLRSRGIEWDAISYANRYSHAGGAFSDIQPELVVVLSTFRAAFE